jgi:hypothetical protein
MVRNCLYIYLTNREDKYPLVVRLPCHKTHLFDLECIQPWLKLHSTLVDNKMNRANECSCPLDRKDLLQKKPEIKTDVSDDEEVWDENYG